MMVRLLYLNKKLYNVICIPKKNLIQKIITIWSYCNIIVSARTQTYCVITDNSILYVLIFISRFCLYFCVSRCMLKNFVFLLVNFFKKPLLLSVFVLKILNILKIKKKERCMWLVGLLNAFWSFSLYDKQSHRKFVCHTCKQTIKSSLSSRINCI